MSDDAKDGLVIAGGCLFCFLLALAVISVIQGTALLTTLRGLYGR
jgi:hypothetical protein